jgi:hypothetical protein
VTRALAAAAVLALALGLAGCGGSDDDEPAATPTSAAPTTPSASETPTSTATTATAAPTADAGGPTRLGDAEAASVLEAAIDDSLGAHLQVENGLGFLSGEGDADFRETPSSLAMTLTSDETGDQQKVVVLVVGTTLYLQDGPSSWLSVDIDSPSNPFGRSLSDQLDPRTVLDAVEQQLVGGTDRGQVEQDGETLHVYRFRAAGPALAQQLAPELASQADVVIPDEVVCDLSVDADGRARSITVDLGADNGQIAYTLTDWRDDVAVDAPPAAQVSALPDLG